MALYWYWYNVIGELVYPNGFKKQMYGGDGCNCLAVLSQKNEKNKWTVYGEFWNDKEHLERMLGLRKSSYRNGENFYSNVKKVRLNTFFDHKELMKIAMPFINRHTTVEFYYKEIKKPKKKEESK